MDITEEMLITNLKDAGCTKETIAAFLYYRKKNEQLKQIEILKNIGMACWIRSMRTRRQSIVWTTCSTN